MSRARHKKAAGGNADDPGENPKEVYAGAESNVRKEATDDREGGEMKKGGRAKKKMGGRVEHKVEGEKAERRKDRPERKRGGKVMHKAGGGSIGNGYCTNEGSENSFTEKAETPRRASGGRVERSGSGSDMSPLSSASKYD